MYAFGLFKEVGLDLDLSPLVFLCVMYSCSPHTALSEQFVPSSVGKKYVFSCFPDTYGMLCIGTNAVGNVVYNVTCASRCSADFRTSGGTFKFPEFKKLTMNMPDEFTTLSVNHLPVIVLTTSAPVSADLFIFKYLETSLAGTSLLSVESASKEYFSLTPQQHGRMLIFSLDYAKTTLQVFPRDNVSYNRRRSARSVTDGETVQDPSSTQTDRLAPNQWSHVELDRYDCYYLTMTGVNSDLSGSHVKSNNPVLMMQGGEEYAGPTGDEKENLLLETAAAANTYSTFYVVLFCPQQSEVGQVKLLTNHDMNQIHIQLRSNITSIILLSAADWFSITVNISEPLFLFSRVSFAVLQIIRANNGEDSRMCMKSVTPFDSWSTYFFWSNAFQSDNDTMAQMHRIHHYAMIVLQADRNLENKLRLDGDRVPAELWRVSKAEIGNKYNYSHVCLQISSTTHEAYIEDTASAKFYVTLSSSTHHAGLCFNPYSNLRTQRPQGLKCTKTETRPGDELDNDCDHKIDEEVRNNLDDDKDGDVDEDLQPDERVDGQWGQWTEFQCVAPCNHTAGVYVRTRTCDNPPVSGSGHPCVGDEEIRRRGVCVAPLVVCKDECPMNTWGTNCNNKCNANCLGGCKKYTGVCNHCFDGFTSDLCNETCPPHCTTCNRARSCVKCAVGLSNPPFCNKHCPRSLYGIDCRTNCSADCVQSECDRISGDCVMCRAGTWGQMCHLLCRDHCKVCQRRSGTCHSNVWRLALFGTLMMMLSLMVLTFMMLGESSDGEESDVVSEALDISEDAEEDERLEKRHGSSLDSDISIDMDEV